MTRSKLIKFYLKSKVIDTQCIFVLRTLYPVVCHRKAIGRHPGDLFEGTFDAIKMFVTVCLIDELNDCVASGAPSWITVLYRFAAIVR